MHAIPLVPLTKTAFAPFGEVVDSNGATAKDINQGFATRFDGLATIDIAYEDGATNIAVFHARPRPVPINIRLMERHPLGSQLFFPLQDQDWLVLVCSDPLDAGTYCGFRATGRQGINYRRNIWHHPLLVLKDDSRFLVVDRAGPGNNLEECHLPNEMRLQIPL